MHENNIIESMPDESAGYIDMELEQQASERRWLRLRNVAIVFFVIIAILMPVLTRGHFMVVATLAWLNCAVFAFFGMHFIRQRTLGSFIPVITTVTMVVGSCLGVVYFAIFYPDATYPTVIEWISFFAGGIRFQLVILLFMLSYFITLTFLLRPERQIIESPVMCTRYIAYWVIIIYVLSMWLSIFVRLVTVPAIIKWFGDGMLIYCNGFMFIAGCLYHRISKKFKIIIFTMMGVMLVLFTLAASRGKAIYPIAFLLMGYLLFSDARPRSKLILLCCFLAALPIYVVVGNTTRVILGTVGFEDFGARVAAIKEWRYAAAKTTDPVMQMFGRFFFTGGNVIVASTPARHPYMPFYPGKFTLETLESLLPRALIYHPYYQGTEVLKEYGLMITEKTSVEVSIVGNLWILGGYVPVIIGGFFMALLHGFIAWRIRLAWLKNPDQAMFYFVVMVQSFMETFNLDIIGSFRQMIWHLAFAFIVFKMISPFLKASYHFGQTEPVIEMAA